MLEHYINTENILLRAHIRGVKDAAPIRQGDVKVISSALLRINGRGEFKSITWCQKGSVSLVLLHQ